MPNIWHACMEVLVCKPLQNLKLEPYHTCCYNFQEAKITIHKEHIPLTAPGNQVLG